jgi:hypothetical protein
MSDPESSSYTLTLTEESNYLHAIVTGENSEQVVRGYLAELLREGLARGCTRLLIEERLEGRRLGTLQVFNIAVEGTESARGHFNAIAFVDVFAQGELMKFAEDVAVNRGLRVAVFSTVAEAKRWLATSWKGDTARAAALLRRRPYAP